MKLLAIWSPSTRATAIIDMKLEAIVIPVSDVDRAKEFYGNLGWRLDADFAFDNGFRVVQFTPPGSGCSVQFGTKITSATSGSAQGLYLIVSNIEAARDQLTAHGANVSDVFHAGTPGAQFEPLGTTGRIRGAAPDHASYSSFVTFSDPDGNGWLLQESPTGYPAASIRSRRPSPRWAIWRQRFAGQQPLTAYTKSELDMQIRIGPTGTPSIWCGSSLASNCPSESNEGLY